MGRQRERDGRSRREIENERTEEKRSRREIMFPPLILTTIIISLTPLLICLLHTFPVVCFLPWVSSIHGHNI